MRRFTADVLPTLGRPGGFRPTIDRELVGLDQAQAALDYMETNANAGKIILHVP